MALRDWVAATATPATPATLDGLNVPTVATVATVAVAASANDDALAAVATAQQVAELRALVAIVAADWPESERDAALAVALADPEAALVSFRALAATATLATTATGSDDRRTCRQCMNLSPGGRCLAAWRGERIGNAGRDYSPVSDLPHRCEGYAPQPGEADQRTGLERWPALTESKAR